MFFELNDGVPKFALGKVVITEEQELFDGTKEAVQREIYLFTEQEMIEYPEAVLIEQPTEAILTKAKQLHGRTLSRTEFEKLLME